MKKLSLFLIAVFIFNLSHAQFQIISLDKVEEIKNSKLVVGLTGDEAIDDAMIAAVKEFWTIGEIGEPMPVDEALAFAKKNDNIIVIKTGKRSSMSPTHLRKNFQATTNSNPFDDYWGYRYVSESNTLELSNGSGKALFTQYIPVFGPKDEITEEILSFGVAAMHYQLNEMQKNQLSTFKIKGKYKEYSTKLKDVTLLIPEGWVDDKMDAATLKELYGAKAEIVPYIIWRNSILKRDSETAYAMICYAPVGGNYVYQHYIMDSATGNVYAIIQKPGASVNVTIKKDVNLTKGNSGYINKKIVGFYNDVLKGEW